MGASRARCEWLLKVCPQFQGCSPWVPYFWGEVQVGEVEEVAKLNGEDIYVFTVNAQDVSVFPELRVGQVVAVYFDGDYVIELEPELIT